MRDLNPRSRGATVTTCATMSAMDEFDERLLAATKRRVRAESAFLAADAEVRELLREGRAVGKGPSHMAKLTGFTREWVAKIAPDPKRQRDAGAARTVADS